MINTTDVDPAPLEQLVGPLIGPNEVLCSTVEVGKLIRWLDRLCVSRLRAGDEEGAKLAASLSADVENALILFESECLSPNVRANGQVKRRRDKREASDEQ